MAAVGAIVASHQHHRSVKKLTLAWTSDASGNVSGIPSDLISGELERFVFVPGAGGVQPTDQYDITLLDEDGVDVLGGNGGNLSNAVASQFLMAFSVPGGGILVDSPLTLVVANAGNAKQGTVKILYR